MDNRNTVLDEIKGLAILSVVLFHFGCFPFGYLGVDIFLAVAGYLTARSIQRNLDKKIFGYWRFIGKRLLRLWPLMCMAVVVSIVFGFIFMLPDDFENLAQAGVASCTFTNNILCMISSGDYWAPNNDFKPLLHFWYLGVLVQFYFFYAALVICVQKRLRFLKLVLAVLVFASGFIWFGGIGTTAQKFYLAPWRFWEFGGGALVCLLGFQVPSTLSLRVPFLAWLGRASLSVYVWHYVMLACLRYAFGSELPCPLQFGYWICLLIVSYVSYRWIEQSKYGWLNDMRSLWWMGLIGALIVIGCFCIYKRAGLVRDVPELDLHVGETRSGIHAQYNDRVRKMNAPFVSVDKKRILVLGNSYARDWANVLLESSISNRIELSYSPQFPLDKDFEDRLKSADYLFVAGCYVDKLPISVRLPQKEHAPPGGGAVCVVGNKYFGVSNGYVYSRRFCDGYKQMRIAIPENELVENEKNRSLYGKRYIDIINRLMDDDRTVPVFSDEGKLISQDCRHLTQAGARFLSQKFDFKSMLSIKE